MASVTSIIPVVGLDEDLCSSNSSEKFRVRSAPVSRYRKWHQAVISDDAKAMRDILLNSSPDTRDLLINGDFVYDETPVLKQIKSHRCRAEVLDFTTQFSKPITLAAVYLAQGSIDVLFDYGVKILTKDAGSNNVIHCLILASRSEPDLEEKLANIGRSILNRISVKQRRTLLLQANDSNVRPVELAALLECWRFVHLLLSTNGVYRFPQGKKGMYESVLYDVDEYARNTGNRWYKSPLRLIGYLDVKDLGKDHVETLFRSPFIRNWGAELFHRGFPYVVISFLFRMFYVFCFALVAGDIFNVSGGMEWQQEGLMTNTTITQARCRTSVGNGISVTLDDWNIRGVPLRVCQALSIVILVLDLWDFICLVIVFGKDRPYLKLVRRYRFSGDTVSSNATFLVIMHLQAWFGCFLSVLLANISAHDEAFQAFVSIDYVLSIVLNFWSLLYYMQDLKSIGHFIITFQRMGHDLLKFLTLYVIISLSFNHAFYSFTTVGCPPDNVSYFQVWYDSFLLSFNILQGRFGPGSNEGLSVNNIREASGYEAYLITFNILHVFYLFIVTVLLINFLIAIMSHSVNMISENRDIVRFANAVDRYDFINRPWFGSKLALRLYLKVSGSMVVESDGKLYIHCYERGEAK